MSVAGKGSVVRVVDSQGEVLLDIGGDKGFIPASTLKIFTVVLAAEHLDLDSHYQTEFFLVDDKLVVKGSGDPYLISEELDGISVALKKALGDRQLSGIWIDDAAFAEGIVIPGAGKSEKPYDALNSATAVNFNQINVKRVDGKILSAEEQTPLTPLAEQRARALGITTEDRINISSDPIAVRRYASELIAAKLRIAGVSVGQGSGAMVAPVAEPLYVHSNSRSLREVCHELLYWSNNYITNQVFLTIGATVHGYPATLEKSQKVAETFLADHPELAGFTVVEGSGLSYDNRATAPAFIALLAMFEQHKDLLRTKHDTPNKTGTLRVRKSVVGYQDTATHGTVRFVISLDGSGFNRKWKVLDLIRKHL
jgi:D-alanyl-D-alanine carboxypeptidase/D-alanyl-D-alanine-endopeptidase (penicillin-binding protein 4)